MPESNLRLLWDFIILFLVFLSILYTPFRLCFKSDKMMQMTLISSLDEFLMIMFSCDALITCLYTGYYSKGVIILNQIKIFKNYLRNLFIWDFISLFPYILSIILNIDDIKLALLLRIFKLSKIFGKFEEQLHLSDKPKGIYELTKLALQIIFVGHFFACFWIYIANIEEQYGVMNTWIHTFNLNNSEWKYKYISSLYFTVYTMVTVGYGDIYPSNIYERTCCIFLMILTCGVFAYSLNIFGSIIQEMNKKDRNFKYSYCLFTSEIIYIYKVLNL